MTKQRRKGSLGRACQIVVGKRMPSQVYTSVAIIMYDLPGKLVLVLRGSIGWRVLITSNDIRHSPCLTFQRDNAQNLQAQAGTYAAHMLQLHVAVR